MSEYFQKEDLEERKQFLAPDYGELGKDTDEDEIDPAEFDDDNEILLDDEEPVIIQTQKAVNERSMTTSPFSGSTGYQPPSFQASSWMNKTPFQSSSTPSQFYPGGAQAQRTEINRSKDVIFCDFLDCIVETLDSAGKAPGMRPRDVYDLKPKMEVWSKLAAYNPKKIFALAPKNLIPQTADGDQTWPTVLSYFCLSLCSFLRLPMNSCQVIASSSVSQTKEAIMESIIRDYGIKKDDVIQVGIYSGYGGLSNADILASERCGIDYVDLYTLLNAQ